MRMETAVRRLESGKDKSKACISFLSIVCALFLGGIGHAYFIEHLATTPWYENSWHFWQIGPIVLLLLSMFAFGAEMMWRYVLNYHNFYGYAGRFLAAFAAIGLGYIIGLELL